VLSRKRCPPEDARGTDVGDGRDDGRGDRWGEAWVEGCDDGVREGAAVVAGTDVRCRPAAGVDAAVPPEPPPRSRVSST
jgi:hypothetical protein